jgi:Fatty acid hydroxylase superfamily
MALHSRSKESQVTMVDACGTAIRHGQIKKRKNAVAAVACGIPPAVLLGFYSSVSWERFLFGALIGVLWGNAFEYAYHRWLLHHPRHRFGMGHREHHARIGTPEAAEHVALASSPHNVFLLFAVNSVPAVLICFLAGPWGILSGVFIGWMLYLIATEEIHWRIHMNGRLPAGFGFARSYHLSHHDVPTSRYNVFLPLWDVLLGSARETRKLPQPGPFTTA